MIEIYTVDGHYFEVPTGARSGADKPKEYITAILMAHQPWIEARNPETGLAVMVQLAHVVSIQESEL